MRTAVASACRDHALRASMGFVQASHHP
jgi:hypothetical protein